MREGVTEPARDPEAQLERALMAEYLERSGHTFESLQHLAPSEADELLKAASRYASGRLAEVEARAHLVQDLHHTAEPE